MLSGSFYYYLIGIQRVHTLDSAALGVSLLLHCLRHLWGIISLANVVRFACAEHWNKWYRMPHDIFTQSLNFESPDAGGPKQYADLY